MGGSESTRRVTVEGDGPGMVKISDDVVRRLRGEEEPINSNSNNTEYDHGPPTPKQRITASVDDSVSAAETKRLQEEYNMKLKELEQKNDDLYEARLQQFSEAVTEVEKKFVNQTSSPICLDLEQQVLQCYQENPKQTLLCSRKVKDFIECVESSRQKILTRTS